MQNDSAVPGGNATLHPETSHLDLFGHAKEARP
jgi:hypothetical protein